MKKGVGTRKEGRAEVVRIVPKAKQSMEMVIHSRAKFGLRRTVPKVWAAAGKSHQSPVGLVIFSLEVFWVVHHGAERVTGGRIKQKRSSPRPLQLEGRVRYFWVFVKNVPKTCVLVSICRITIRDLPLTQFGPFSVLMVNSRK